MKPLTEKMVLLLLFAAKSADGTVLTRGYGLGWFATVTAKALCGRGLLAYVKDAKGGGTVYRITDAGREHVTTLYFRPEGK